ncbi:MAG: biotin/lipoate A/B protein ligase family protein [bacterium]|nr:biotin/lipoate A/B protein ligase family protein [bacterium]
MNKSGIWRLLDDEPRNAEENMAVDEALALSMAKGESLPVLRCYRWSSPALTYGYFQNPAREIDIDYCRRNNISFSRRMTGGGVVLHLGDLTYSVITDKGFFGERKDALSTYEILHGAVKRALGILGINSELCAPGAPVVGIRRRGCCFVERSRYDILVNNAKIAGSAQRKLSNVLIHQGYIMLYNVPEGSSGILKGKAVDRIDMPSGFPSRDSMISAMEKCFRDGFSLKFESGHLSAAESESARRLSSDKYSSDGWKYLH